MLHLEKVTHDNFYALMQLKVAPEQSDFVAPNDYSLAEAYAVLSGGGFVQAFGIFLDDTPVGFAMVGHNCFDNDDQPEIYRNSYYIWRFMIAAEHQGRGYGRAAFSQLLAYVRTLPDGPAPVVCLSYEPENTAAKALYASFGFKPTGEMDYDEEIAALPLSN